MKTFIKQALIATAFAALPLGASAAQLAFDLFADDSGNPGGGEHGVADGTRYQFDGLWVGFSASSTVGEGYAYFDKGQAGLGVCATLDSSAQCTPSNDDNLTTGEELTLTFWTSKTGSEMVAVILENLRFRDADHNDITDNTYLLNGVERLMSDATPTLASTTFTFGYGGSNANQYYLRGSTGTAIVPEPSALLMLLTGMIGVGIARKRAKA